ncbi:MAG: assimilatory sulfite reductase (NADPH) flavoprotein subunit [Pseudomonadota bacterium]
MATAAASVIEQTDLPLSGHELQKLEASVAGLSTGALLWSSGYLAGLARNGSKPALPEVAAAPDTAARLKVLYGSQTGTGEQIARQLAETARADSLPLDVQSLADFRVRDLGKQTHVLFVLSTHGEGEPPDDAEDLIDWLMSERAPRLEKLNFAVLALGDSSYAQFCETGRQVDERLKELGAKQLFARVDCDLDYESAADAWSGQVLKFAGELQESAPVGKAPLLRAVSNPTYSAEHPLQAELLVNQKITGRNSDKDVRHLVFDIEGSSLSFEPGDSLGVIVQNPPALVSELAGLLSLDLAEQIGERTLGQALSEDFEITAISSAFVKAYAELSGRQDLQSLLAAERREELAEYLQSHQVIDVVRQHPCQVSAAEFVATLRKLAPRLYSISSSYEANPDEVSITVSAVRYEAFGQEHWGAGSTFLADRLDVGMSASIFIEPNPRFRLPVDENTPVVMIGPGTGVAPFRAFMEQRDYQGAQGDNWLFFGDRSSSEDFLYQLDWARLRKSGLLQRMNVAFSRDQASKHYVQDELRKSAVELVQWIDQGAHLYVCGDMSRMAKDVHEALIDIISSVRSIDQDAAALELKQLKRAGRYQRDVY